MSGVSRFPFGASSTPRPPRQPNGGAAALVLGVYPSAFHVRWTPPAWLAEKSTTVGALAVADEPTVFWDGSDPAEDQVFESWKASTGFISGDDTGQWGHVHPSGNGTSGRPVVARVLEPLGLRVDDSWFTDAVNVFFIKGGSAKGRGQADVLHSVYDPFATKVGGLRPASLPARPSPSALVRLATTEHRDRLRREFVTASPEVVITLGEEARQALRAVSDSSSGVPLEPLTRSRFGGVGGRRYGEAGSVKLGGMTAKWYALVHPGQRDPMWRSVHEAWVDRRSAGG